jgi:hypothetical protein
VTVGLGVSENSPPLGGTRGAWPSSSLVGRRRGVAGAYFAGIVICLLGIPRRVQGAYGPLRGLSCCSVVKACLGCSPCGLCLGLGGYPVAGSGGGALCLFLPVAGCPLGSTIRGGFLFLFSALIFWRVWCGPRRERGGAALLFVVCLSVAACVAYQGRGVR